MGTQAGQEPELGSPGAQWGGENDGAGQGMGGPGVGEAASRMCNSRRQQELRRLWVIWGIFGKCECDVSLSERKASGEGGRGARGEGKCRES